MFSVEERERLREGLVDMARADERIVAGALVGSLTEAVGDRWSDLDLGFGVARGYDMNEVLRDRTVRLASERAAVRLFDLQVFDITYRLFLFPGGLQVDLSFAPGAVAQTGPKFELLFGDAIEQYAVAPSNPEEVVGLCVH